MKKLYSKGTVHPSPPIKSDQLPGAILSLSPEDREVLAYLLSAEPQRHKAADHQPPLFNCTCFSCYLAFWLRWDSSPNRHLIHHIIDALEDPQPQPPKKPSSSRKKRSANKPRPDSKPESPEQSTSTSAGGDCQEKGSILSFIGEKIWGVWG